MKITKRTSDVLPSGVCELHVGYRRVHAQRVKITSAEEVVKFAMDNFYTHESIEYSEKFFVIFLDRSNQAFAWKCMSEGGMSGTVADVRLIFQTALLVHSPQIILLHNHPSGETKPSNADVKLTSQLKQAGTIMEIEVLDHVIITSDVNKFYSFANQGTL